MILLVGGAREAFLAEEGKNDLVLKKRRGFFEVALKTGASLVPVSPVMMTVFFSLLQRVSLGFRGPARSRTSARQACLLDRVCSYIRVYDPVLAGGSPEMAPCISACTAQCRWIGQKRGIHRSPKALEHSSSCGVCLSVRWLALQVMC